MIFDFRSLLHTGQIPDATGEGTGSREYMEHNQQLWENFMERTGALGIPGLR
jgi:hypothetical protein